MNELDDSILEFLQALGNPADERVGVNPKQVWLNLAHLRDFTDKSADTVSRRMADLDEMGLLDRLDTPGAYYTLTEKGERYLSGDLTSDDLPRPE